MRTVSVVIGALLLYLKSQRHRRIIAEDVGASDVPQQHFYAAVAGSPHDAAFWFAGARRAQYLPYNQDPDTFFYVVVRSWNAVVTDRNGSVITGFDASKFRLFEDGTEQAVKYCASEDVPVSVGLVLETRSASFSPATIQTSMAMSLRAYEPGSCQTVPPGAIDLPLATYPF